MTRPPDRFDSRVIEDRVRSWACRHFGHSFCGFETLDSGARAYSHWIRFRVTTASDGQQNVRELFGKQPLNPPQFSSTYAQPDPVYREWAALQDATRRLATLETCCVPEPLGISDDGTTLIMTAVAGVTLDSQLQAAKWWSASHALRRTRRQFELLGQWLRQYQQTSDGQQLPPVTLMPLLEQAQQRLQAAVARSEGVLPSTFTQQVMSRLSHESANTADEVEATFCHGDFGPWNVVVTESSGGCTVVDFSCAQTHSRWLDVANVVTYLEYLQLSPTLQRGKLQELREAFESGYGARLPSTSIARACAAYQRICRLFDLAHESTQGWLPARRRRRDLLAWSRRLMNAFDEKTSQAGTL